MIQLKELSRLSKTFSGVAVLLFTGLLMAQSGIEPASIERAGQSGWQFLKLNGDPRQAALGGSVMITNNTTANAVFGSPAILTLIDQQDLQINSMMWVADIGYYSLAYAQRVGRLGVFALSMVALDYGEMEETIHAPLQGGGTYPLITGETFTANDLAVGISYAKKITDQLSLGGSVRYLNEKIAGTGMSNWSVDFSTHYFTGFRTLRISIAARNFGPDAHLVGYNEDLQSEPVDIRMPLELRSGVAYDILEQDEDPHLWTVMFEGKVPSDGSEKFHFGSEYSFSNMIFLRAGYRFNYDEEGLTVGAGVHYPIGRNLCSFNYAFLDFGALRQVHMFSIGWTVNN